MSLERNKELARAAIERFPSEIYLLPHYHHLLAFAQAELYRGNPDRALERIEAEWKGLERSKLLSVQCLRVEIRHLFARQLQLVGWCVDGERQAAAIQNQTAVRRNRLDANAVALRKIGKIRVLQHLQVHQPAD